MSPYPPQHYKRIREERKELIINTAQKLFAEKGFHSTSINDIAKQASISKGLMYNYFLSKEELLVELLKKYIEIMTSFLEHDTENNISCAHMERFIDRMIDSFEKHRELWKLYIQVSVQQEVVNLIISKADAGQLLLKHKELMLSYFKKNYDKPEEQLLLFNAIIKGLAIQIVFAPHWQRNESINNCVSRMKKMFIKSYHK